MVTDTTNEPLRSGLEAALTVIPRPRLGPNLDQADPIQPLITKTLRDAIAEFVGDEVRYKVYGSTGIGKWANTPWVSIFDLNVTEKATRGFYLVYLFRADGEAVHLSLNQGTTEVRKKVGGQYQQELQRRADQYLQCLEGQDLSGLNQDWLDLAFGSTLTDGYVVGNIAALTYKRGEVPAEPQLQSDLARLVGVYQELVQAVGQLPIEAGEKTGASYTEVRRLGWHKRVEGRNRGAVTKAKRHHGYACRVCGLDYQQLLGVAGRRCVDAHHLVPFQTLTETPTAVDPINDFAIVCATCHRLLHTRVPPLELDEAKALRSAAGLSTLRT